MHGVEPVRRHLEGAARALAAAEPEVAARVRMGEGVAQRLAEPDSSVDLIWCRNVLGHIEDLEAVFGEFGWVLRPGGAAVICQMTATDWLTSVGAARLWPPIGAYASGEVLGNKSAEGAERQLKRPGLGSRLARAAPVSPGRSRP